MSKSTQKPADCSKKNEEESTTDNKMDEVEVHETVPPDSSKLNYKSYFRYDTNAQNEKIGVCLLCKANNIVKEVKMKNSNTSGLKYHLNKDHKPEAQLLFGSQHQPKKSTLPSNQKTMDLYSNKKDKVEVDWDKITCLWVAYKNLPLNFFNDPVTQNFFKLLNPNLQMPKKDSMKEKVIDQFKKMQDNLKLILKNNDSEFSFAVDGWSARNGASYYGITLHFIDENWNYHSLVLDLIPSNGKHTGFDVAGLFFNALQEYGIQEKVQGITLDNASANTTFIKELGILMNKENIEFNVNDKHFRCFAHIANLGVQDVLKLINVGPAEDNVASNFSKSTVQVALNDDVDEGNSSDDNSTTSYEDDGEEDQAFSKIITKIRSTCKKIRYSEQLTDRLKLFCKAVNVQYVKLILDVKTRWDSTYDMLNVAFKLKPALSMLWQNCKEFSEIQISEEEWVYLEKILNFLKYFKHFSKLLSGQSYVTLPSVVVAFNILVDKIESIVKELDCKPDRNQSDEILILAFQAGRDKLLKHYMKCNWMYCVSLILDPRHKLECFDYTQWGREIKEESVNKFEMLYRKKYVKLVTASPKKEAAIPKTQHDDSIDFNYLYASKNVEADSWKAELNAYYQAPRADKDIDILEWWSDHKKVYPNLAKMARDILSLLATSVPVERLFSEGSLLMTNIRSSLKTPSMRALICLNSWFKSSLKVKICDLEYL